MAYDEELADRIRLIIGGDPALTATLTEKKMFGGLAFLIAGNMAISASREGGVLVRVDPAESGRLTETTGATVAVMGGREMTGWLRVGAAEVDTDSGLIPWVARGTACARALPSKR
jgi:TfoX N-terminal domain